MTIGSDHPDRSIAACLPEPEALLCGTDWAALDDARGSAEDIPAALVALLDPDPAIRAEALERGLEPVRHQNSVYPATPPAALYVASILSDPRTLAVGAYDLERGRPPESRELPFRAALLDWLCSLALDVDDACVEAIRRFGSETHPESEALRALRPVFFRAVAVFLRDGDQDVRDAALAVAVSLVEDPALAGHRLELVPLARELLAAGGDPAHRRQAIRGLRAWGHDPSDLTTSDDVPVDPWAGGCADDPPF
ncbi:hypothetical protein [Embleya sp. NBC_00896]|uniref:hypothetical protein n=1 Tax=Embleya sp. NBC_00896 TaxID=2975961 RepID=UPI0038662510|nr:hypothetical protein OG928_46675 [Embleya sp. NBC_00896]